MRNIPGTIADPSQVGPTEAAKPTTVRTGFSLTEETRRLAAERDAEKAASTEHTPERVVEAIVSLRVAVTAEQDAAALLKLSVLARGFAEADTSRTVQLRGFAVELEG